MTKDLRCYREGKMSCGEGCTKGIEEERKRGDVITLALESISTPNIPLLPLHKSHSDMFNALIPRLGNILT